MGWERRTSKLYADMRMHDRPPIMAIISARTATHGFLMRHGCVMFLSARKRRCPSLETHQGRSHTRRKISRRGGYIKSPSTMVWTKGPMYGAWSDWFHSTPEIIRHSVPFIHSSVLFPEGDLCWNLLNLKLLARPSMSMAPLILPRSLTRLFTNDWFLLLCHEPKATSFGRRQLP